MRIQAQKAFHILISIYLLLIFVVLPLYMQNGLIQIGDAKYSFFRDRTLLFVPLIIVCAILQSKNKKPQWSAVDIAVLSFALVSVLSFVTGSDKQTAFWGYDGWYMGLLSQLLFVFIYFAVSRGYDGEEYIWQFAGVTAAAVFVLGILNRMNYDPLGVYEGITNWEWNHNHLLSTIGHYNWYCGYASVAGGISLYYGYTGKRLSRVLGLIGTFVTFASLITQGSETAYPVLLVFLLILFLDSARERRKLLRFLVILSLLPAACIFWQIWAALGISDLNLISDGSMDAFLFFPGWWLILCLLLGLCFLVCYREKSGKTDYVKKGTVKTAGIIILLFTAAIGTVILVLCCISDSVWALFGNNSLLRLNFAWGNSRGGLWYMSVMGWLKGGVKNILLGVGPDCFSDMIYSVFDVDLYVADSGQEGVVFANAHNEWLNMLVNEGLLGAAAYIAVFAAAFRRILKNISRKQILLAALLALGGYMINGVFSFQQTVSTPLIFAILGMAEREIRESGTA